MRIALARLLLAKPDLLLLDEPTVGVDPLSRRELWKILKTFVKEEHLSIFVSTAYMNEAEICSHVFVLHKGNLLADGTPMTLIPEAKQFTGGEKGVPVWSILMNPTPITAETLDVVIDADHVTQKDVCKGAMASVAACQ